ncbi:MAG: glucuronate isomerase, partial [Spirochaetota bacterium]
MKTFITEDFLLETETAGKLYHEYAEAMPIYDYHCHIPPQEIAENASYHTLTQMWLGGDHYKWRAMRTDGVEEQLVTGEAEDWEKFQAWARTVPHTIGNPLYHWTHLELLRYFNIDTLLCAETAEEIYTKANKMLQSEEFRVKSLIKRMNVKAICTTDDPVDSLGHHQLIAQDPDFDTRVVPTFRPDRALMVEDPARFQEYINRLAESTSININNYHSFISALDQRHQYFHNTGCRLSDHALVRPFAEPYTKQEVQSIFTKLLQGKTPTTQEALKFKTGVMVELGCMNAERGWTMQLHIGALRNNNTKMFRTLGPDTGFDSMA